MELYILFVLSSILSLVYSMELFATYNNIGITKYTTKSQCSVNYCQGGACRDGMDLFEVVPGKFVGSILWLQEGTSYTVRVDCEGEVDHGDINTRSPITIPTPLHEVYIAVDGGDDQTECTQAEPCSFGEAVTNHVQPGTHFLLKAGIYDREIARVDGDMNFNSYGMTTHGTKENPIVFKPQSNAGEVIFDGSKEIDSLQTISGGTFNIYRYQYPEDFNTHTVVMIEKRCISNHQLDANRHECTQRLVQYFDRQQFEDLFYISEVDDVTPNYGFHFDEGNKLLDINIGNLNVDDYSFFFSVVSPLMTIMADYYYFHDLTFRYYGKESYNFVFYLRNSSNVWIRNCKFDHVGKAAYFKWYTEHILIEESRFYDSRFIFNWDAVKANDNKQEAGAISLGMGEMYQVGRGLVIRNNEFYDFFDAFNLQCGSDIPWYDIPTNEVDIHNNYIENCRDDGFELDGISSNIRSYSNRVENTISGISQAPMYIGPSYLINNIMYRIHGWTCWKFIFGNRDPPSGVLISYHNVAVNKYEGSGVSVGDFPWKYNEFRNNVLIGCGRAISISADEAVSPLSMDYDLVGVDEKCHDQYNYFTYKGSHFVEWDDFRDAANQEEHGIYVKGNFSEIFIDDEDFRLQQDYPGVLIPGVNDQFHQNIGLLFPFEAGNGGSSEIDHPPISPGNVGVIIAVVICLSLCMVIVFVLVVVGIIVAVFVLRKGKMPVGKEFEEF